MCWFPRAVVAKYHRLGGFNSELYCLAVLEAGSARSFQQGWVFLKVVRETRPGLSPSPWWSAGSLWTCLAYGSMTLRAAFILTGHSPCVQWF